MVFRVERISTMSNDPGVHGAYQKDGKYYLKIDTLEELWALVGPNSDPNRKDHCGWDTQSVILTMHHDTKEPVLEIYDDWRE